MARFALTLLLVACSRVPRAPALPLVPPPAPGTEATNPVPLFASYDPIDLEIAGPLRRIWRERKNVDPAWFDAYLTFPHNDASRTIPVRIRVRGHTRAERCSVPPYKLKVETESAAGTLFAGQRSMRVVSHCHDDHRYEQHALEEYLVYRIFSLLTELSFRVRLVRMTYRDTESRESETYFAVFIEHSEQLAARTGWQVVRKVAVARRSIEPNQAALVAVFNFVIGNTDFSFLRGPRGELCCHNVVLVGSQAGPFLPIPLDFDSAGIIDAPYAAPSPAVPIASVRERYYRGLCLHDNYVPDLLRLLITKRSDIEALYEKQEGLDADRRQYALEYLDESYELIADPEAVVEKIMERCR